MQARAADDLRKLVTDKLAGAGLAYEGAKAFATPRRLALAVAGLHARQPDVREEKKGPRVDRGDRRDRARGGEDLPVAEIDALGGAFGEARRTRLGAAAAVDCRDL